MRILAIINALVTLLHTALCYDTNINSHYLAGQTTNSQTPRKGEHGTGKRV